MQLHEFLQQNVLQEYLNLIDIIVLSKTSKQIRDNINPYNCQLYNPFYAIKKLFYDSFSSNGVILMDIADECHNKICKDNVVARLFILQCLYTPMWCILSKEPLDHFMKSIHDGIDYYSIPDDVTNRLPQIRNLDTCKIHERCKIHKNFDKNEKYIEYHAESEIECGSVLFDIPGTTFILSLMFVFDIKQLIDDFKIDHILILNYIASSDINGKKIDKSITERLEDEFTMEFEKVFYDGKSLKICNLNSVIKKESDYVFSQHKIDFIKNLGPESDYIEAIFDVPQYDNYSDILSTEFNLFNDKTSYNINRYNKCGFKILNSNLEDLKKHVEDNVNKYRDYEKNKNDEDDSSEDDSVEYDDVEYSNEEDECEDIIISQLQKKKKID